MTAGLLLSALGSVAVGAWIRRAGARWPMVAGTLVATSALVAMACSPPGPWIMAPLALLGATGAALLYEPAFAAVGAARADPAQRSRAIQLVSFWGGWAALWSLPAATLLAARWGWRTALLALAAALVVATLPVHARLPRSPAVPAADRARSTGGGCRPVGASWPFRLTLAFAVVGCSTGALAVHGVALLGERGVPAVTASLLFAAMAPVQVAGRAWLLRRTIGRHEAMAPFVLVAGGLVALLAAPHDLALAFFVVLFGIGAGLSTSVRAALAAARIPVEHLATELGTMGLVLQLARAAAPTLGAVSHEVLGFRGAIGVALALAIVGGGLVASCGLPLRSVRA
jgi:hypothetical protein